jgi:hypothetical protein
MSIYDDTQALKKILERDSNIGAIKFSDLSGPDNKSRCWSVGRGLRKCHKCDKYAKCDSKIVNPKYDDLMARRAAALEKHRQELEALDNEIGGID